jgi:hypothetical protein
MAFCPEEAVEAGHSWAVILYYITTVPAGVLFLAWVGRWIPFLADLESSWFRTLLKLLWFYPSLFISYYLFHALTRVPLINALFTCTTLTRFYRRYHEPGARPKDLGPPHGKAPEPGS